MLQTPEANRLSVTKTGSEKARPRQVRDRSALREGATHPSQVRDSDSEQGRNLPQQPRYLSSVSYGLS